MKHMGRQRSLSRWPWNAWKIFLTFFLFVTSPGFAAQPSTVAWSPHYVMVSETNGTAQLQVIRTGDTNLDFTVDFATSNATASAGADYEAQAGTLHFVAGAAPPTTTFTSPHRLRGAGAPPPVP